MTTPANPCPKGKTCPPPRALDCRVSAVSWSRSISRLFLDTAGKFSVSVLCKDAELGLRLHGSCRGPTRGGSQLPVIPLQGVLCPFQVFTGALVCTYPHTDRHTLDLENCCQANLQRATNTYICVVFARGGRWILLLVWLLVLCYGARISPCIRDWPRTYFVSELIEICLPLPS